MRFVGHNQLLSDIPKRGIFIVSVRAMARECRTPCITILKAAKSNPWRSLCEYSTVKARRCEIFSGVSRDSLGLTISGDRECCKADHTAPVARHDREKTFHKTPRSLGTTFRRRSSYAIERGYKTSYIMLVEWILSSDGINCTSKFLSL